MLADLACWPALPTCRCSRRSCAQYVPTIRTCRAFRCTAGVQNAVRTDAVKVNLVEALQKQNRGIFGTTVSWFLCSAACPMTEYDFARPADLRDVLQQEQVALFRQLQSKLYSSCFLSLSSLIKLRVLHMTCSRFKANGNCYTQP